MDCLEFRRRAGGDPRHPDGEALEHAAGCAACAAHLRELRRMDVTILAALRVPAAASGPRPSPAASVAGAVLGDRRRWFALAASIAGGVAVGALLWASGPRDALARDVVRHVEHEPAALVPTQTAADPLRVREVLARDGVRLVGGMGLVTYVRSCEFRGHEVPHLVVQTADGPVTVLLLPQERVDGPVQFHEGRYVGTIEPLGAGAVAVIGGSPTQVREATRRVTEAVQWQAG